MPEKIRTGRQRSGGAELGCPRMRRTADPEAFWDERAREAALFFVDNRLDYRRPDVEGFWASGEAVVDALLQTAGVELDPAARVLDLGCGVGRLTRVLARRVALVHGLDVAQAMLDRAEELNADLDNVRWLHGDGATLRPLADGSVDACLSFVVFQHLPDPQITLGYVREMGRVLVPGGWAVFQVSNDPSVHRPPRGLARLRHQVRAVTRRGPRGFDHPAWLGSAVDLDALAVAAREGGLAIERVEHAGTQFCLVLARRTAPGASDAGG